MKISEKRLWSQGNELQDHLIEQQEQLQILQDQLAEMQQGSLMSGSTLTELVQQQLESEPEKRTAPRGAVRFLAQGVFCLGGLCLRLGMNQLAMRRQAQDTWQTRAMQEPH